MLKVGLTGGIASGKSVVGGMFSTMGVHLVLADQVAHELMQPGQAVYDEVVRCFGPEILNPDGTIHRGRLAALAFGTKESNAGPRVQELNAIVHPAVVKREDEWMEQTRQNDPHAIAMVEAALILEAGVAKRFDRLIVVTCGPEQRVERFAKRQGLSENAARTEVARRMAAQISDEEKVKAADFVIDNSGSLPATEEQVLRLFATLKKEAAVR